MEITFDELLKKVENKYLLAIIASKRFRELAKDEKVYEHILISKTLNEIINDELDYTSENL